MDAGADRREGRARGRCQGQEDEEHESGAREKAKRFKEEVELSELVAFRWSVVFRAPNSKTRNEFLDHRKGGGPIPAQYRPSLSLSRFQPKLEPLMLTVTFAFVVATALFFLFRQTRWMGVVGVFVLLCISPLFFGGLLLLVGVAYYLLLPTKDLPDRLPIAQPATRRGGQAYTKYLPAAARVGCRRGARARLLGADFRERGLADHRRCAFRASRRGHRAAYARRLAGGLQDPNDGGVRRTVRHTILGVEIGETEPRIRVPAVYRLPRRAGARVAGREDRTACSRSWRQR